MPTISIARNCHRDRRYRHQSELSRAEARLFRPKLDAAYSWRPPGVSVEPGAYPVGHGTMCAYAALLAAPRATLIDVPAFIGEPPGGAIMGRRLSVSLWGNSGACILIGRIAFTASGRAEIQGACHQQQLGHVSFQLGFPRRPSRPLCRQSEAPVHPQRLGDEHHRQCRHGLCRRQLRRGCARTKNASRSRLRQLPAPMHPSTC